MALIGDTYNEDSEVFIMSDDGSGHSINIPSFLIRQETFNTLQTSYAAGEHIIIKVSIESPESNNNTA